MVKFDDLFFEYCAIFSDYSSHELLIIERDHVLQRSNQRSVYKTATEDPLISKSTEEA